MTTPSDLVSDPVFQLNALLWLASPLPPIGPYKPILRDAGFEIYSIAPMLAPPPDVLLRLKETGLAHQERFRPDVILADRQRRCFVLVECKANSFGTASSTAEQARTLLVVCGDRLHDTLNVAPTDIASRAASYFIPERVATAMRETLEDLDKELASKRLPKGKSVLLMLCAREESIDFMADELAQTLMGIPESTRFVVIEADTDPRPLYFIPYDPDCDQLSEEREFCKRVLFERIHSEILGSAGRSLPPVTIPFDADGLLDKSTMGMYGFWENRESQSHLKRLVRQLVEKLMEKVNDRHSGAFVATGNWTWQLRIEKGTQESLCDVLSRFSCETMDLRAEPEPYLFDVQQ